MIEGADHLVIQVQRLHEKADAGLYTGVAGFGMTALRVWKATGKKKYKRAAETCLQHLLNAKQVKDKYKGSDACHFNGVTDIISGSAGICSFLLAAHVELESDEALSLAAQVCDGLLLDGIPLQSKNGRRMLRWRTSDDWEREYPNFSHGTAGVCWTLMLVDAQLKANASDHRRYNGRFLDAAIAGGNYLHSIANSAVSNRGLIFHHSPGGERLFYLGWCHGPAGTAKVLQQLSEVTGDQRFERLSQLGNAALLDHQLSRRRTMGFWNNVGLCCGSAGVAKHLKRVYDRTEDPQMLAECRRLTDDILGRAERIELPTGKTGLRWMNAEHRVKPNELKAQTGLMQGASGVGIWLLEMHELEQRTAKK